MRLSLARGFALPVCLFWAVIAAAQSGPQSDPFAAPATRPASTQPSAPLYITSQSDVIIPFSIRATDAQGRAPAKVRIYVSLDQGRTWDLYQEVKPEEKGFRFRPKRDAEFWFATQTVAADGTTDRQDQRVAQMRLIIDTAKPRLQITPRLDESGRVHLTWTAADPFLQNNSVRLEWQDPTSGGWQSVTATTSPGEAATRGQVAARSTITPPAGLEKIVIRGEAADSAGNKTILTQQFELKAAGESGQQALLPSAPGSGALAQRWTPEQNDPYTRRPTNIDPALPRVQPNTALAKVGPTNQLPPPREELPHDDQQPQLVRNPYSPTSGGTPARPANTGELLPPADDTQRGYPNQTESLPPPTQNDGLNNTPSFNAPDNEYQSPRGYSSPRPSETIVRPEPIEREPIAPPRRVEAISPPQGDRPRMTNSKRFSLDYDVEAVGPEGVADVELWGTGDRGQTWVKWGSDPDRATPFEVEVSNEAIYGFRIVIVGRNGLASNTPQTGDAADIWVGVDLAKPHARLTGATIAGGEQAGKLEIRWDANDDHFGPRPITLAVSDRAAGPFTPIAAGLPNTGRYFWEFDPRIRRQLFIRIEAQDEAGNLAADQLTDPISIEGLAPKGRIRDLAPAPNGPPQAFRSPLFR
ncbi:hypothetical protein ETAA8_49120 [Anatilimnocola aggregata]|uniref:Ser-Thr-rich glycosyl-phosphatidyl-inositol-anchored membrane family protein n=1 Tax=Anatilimnocola aggregata TaxID=2528021 RepID=A0A517YHS4_9BACT|nr:hypothetical protein [Anatilimnocola aggregata]QDU29797.1 hypothetical protein ETAA8_49120 [Anatilimnocola aggregata]